MRGVPREARTRSGITLSARAPREATLGSSSQIPAPARRADQVMSTSRPSFTPRRHWASKTGGFRNEARPGNTAVHPALKTRSLVPKSNLSPARRASRAPGIAERTRGRLPLIKFLRPSLLGSVVQLANSDGDADDNGAAAEQSTKRSDGGDGNRAQHDQQEGEREQVDDHGLSFQVGACIAFTTSLGQCGRGYRPVVARWRCASARSRTGSDAEARVVRCPGSR